MGGSKWCVFLCLISVATSANILAVVPTISRSHYKVFEVLISELAQRGHNVTAITTFPQKSPVTNLKEISVKGTRTVLLNNFTIQSFSNIPESFFEVAPKFFLYFDDTDKVLQFPDVVNIISSNVTFDLIMYEMFNDDVFLGFSHKFKAPVIAISSCYMFPWVPDRFGIPANPSYVPDFYSGGYSKHMNLYQRVKNTFYKTIGRLFFHFILKAKLTDLIRKHFGEDIPPVDQLFKHISIYFVNTHFSFYGGQPLPPQVVDISGVHLKQPTTLNKVPNYPL